MNRTCSGLYVALFAAAICSGQTAPSTRPAANAESRKEVSKISPEAVERGQKTFQSNCSFCHGATGKGGESGPDLLRSVVVLDDEGGDKIAPIVHGSRVDKGMPKFALADDQIAEISAFLHDRIQAAASRDSYKILNIVTGDPQKGEAYFNAHCTSCHSVTGDLAHVGSRFDPVEVQQHIVMPREMRWGRAPGPPPPKLQIVTATVTLQDGQTFSGPLRHLDDFSVAIVDDNGDSHSFTRNGEEPKIEVHDPLQGHTDLLRTYSDADIHNLTAFLVTLK